jgi:hypothetical protein
MPIEEGQLRFPGGLKIPINPSIGLVATTPREIQRTASDSGPYVSLILGKRGILNSAR